MLKEQAKVEAYRQIVRIQQEYGLTETEMMAVLGDISNHIGEEPNIRSITELLEGGTPFYGG